MGSAARTHVVENFDRSLQAKAFLQLALGLSQERVKGRYHQRLGKRLLDLALAVFALIITLPIMTALAVLVRVSLGRPVVFLQERPGFRGKPFFICKFRTMTNATDKHGNLLPDAERITTLGRFLRNNSLDELPELFNVLKGDMSFVGPRPLLMQYLDRYTPEQERRHEVKPGITGWAQVNGRNTITWEDKFKFDVWYVDNTCFWLDLKIICMTIWKIVKREGISQPGHVTAEEYKGVSDAYE